MGRNLEMPWSMEDTIENMDHIRDMLIKSVRKVNLDGKAEEDVREINFDFSRVKEALEKQIAKQPINIKKISFSGSIRETFRNGECPLCKAYVDTDDDPNVCSKCGQKLSW